MTPEQITITKDTFEKMDDSSKLNVLYDYAVATHDESQAMKKIHYEHTADCNKRFKKIEKRKIVNTGAAAAGGVLGGWSAVWAYFKFKIGS